MKFNPWPIARYERISQSCGVLTVVIGGTALVGWFTDSVLLKGVRSSYIPMAPSTAVVFLVLGAILGAFTSTSKTFRLAARIGALIAATLAATRLNEYLTDLELKVDHWLFRFPAEPLGAAPVGKMALYTAITFLLLSAAVLLSTVSKPRWANDLAKVLSVVVGFIGLAFLLGYFYGAPLLYGGRSIPMAMNTAICFLISGVGLFVRASVRDIGERRTAHEALQKVHDELEARVSERTDELRAQQEFLRAIVDTSPNAIFVKDAQGRFTLVNAAVENAYGRSGAEIIGKTESDLSGHHEEIQTFVQDDEQVLQTLRPKFIPEEQLTNSSTGETRSFQTIKVPLILPGTSTVHILGVATDITDRKRAEQAMRDTEAQLRQSQKLEGIGQLAGGIAHDFNNLLTVISGFSALAMKGLSAEDPLRDNLEEIKKAGDRAASLTRQLLAFSRKQVLQPEILNLDSVVTEMEKMLRRVIGENIDLCAVLEPKLGSVKADPGQIEQIVLNLVVNARDSMPGGGKVTIETDNVYLDEEYANNHVGARAGYYVMLAVSDTGTGMEEETQARIFEPFFTTKELGKGTGLGLSTIYGIVKQSGGNIWVYSEIGQGTTFKIYLPRVDEEAQEYRRTSTEEVVQGTETILLVEDEEMVRKLARQILATQGYRVLEAPNGGAALLMCEHHQEPIDLLLTDVIMPEMSGRELAERLHRLRPELPVLFMSGYTDDAIVHHGVLEAGANFIQKPFAPDVLATKVRQVLEQN